MSLGCGFKGKTFVHPIESGEEAEPGGPVNGGLRPVLKPESPGRRHREAPPLAFIRRLPADCSHIEQQYFALTTKSQEHHD